MTADIFLVVRWWGTLFLVGAAAFPLTKRLFADWWDGGYFFSKAVGMAVVTWIVYALGTIRVMQFSVTSIVVALMLVFLLGVALGKGNRVWRSQIWLRQRDKGVIIWEEIFFFAALLFWSWIKAHEPNIRGLEKFMDFGFMQSILNTQFFPAPDMWYAAAGINYYYFGHIVTAVLTKLSGIDLAISFNLMLATLFALTSTMSFSIGKQLLRGIGGIGEIGGGVLTAFLVTLAGNLQTIYAFTKGYVGDNVHPFWQLLWGIGDIGGIGEIGGKIAEGINRYWYANATRFIPYTIHEFPGYSFVVSDVHGHVLNLPFVLLAIALIVKIWGDRGDKGNWGRFLFYGFLVGILLMTNALDGPIYFGLLVAILIIQNLKFKVQNWKTMAGKMFFVVVTAGITSLPFLVHFKSFVSGVAVNCPPAFLANTQLGPLIFEGVEKCQRSPIWMMLILWGFFLYCGLWLVGRWIRAMEVTEKLLPIFFFFSMALIVFPEFFYFKDIYPAHFRSNTMFKLGYQAFILFAIVSAYAIVALSRKKLFLLLFLPLFFLVSIYPVFAVRSYFGELKKYEGIDGLGWMRREYPDDWAAIQWLNHQNVKCQMFPRKDSGQANVKCDRFAIVEADGDSYTDYNRFSAFTGIPTVVGWAVHEWLWRGSYDVVAPRREEVRKIYESTDLVETKELLKKYGVRYVVLGSLERTKFKNLQEWKFVVPGTNVFQSGETAIYEVNL